MVKSINLNSVKVIFGTLLMLCFVTDGYCYNNYRDIVDRYGYHYYRGSNAPDRKYEAPYYNNTGYYTYADPLQGRLSYYKGYDNYNNGYYKGGFYGNEYYHNGYFNNGYYNPGNCVKKDCRIRARIPGSK